MVDFDSIEDWEPSVSAALHPFLPESLALKLAEAAPEFVEDARDIVFELAGRDVIIDATLSWIRSTAVAGYHGSRLTDEEIASVRSEGLIPLKAEARRARLVRALSSHPKWDEVAEQLDTSIYDHGPGRVAGGREGQVHFDALKGRFSAQIQSLPNTRCGVRSAGCSHTTWIGGHRSAGRRWSLSRY